MESHVDSLEAIKLRRTDTTLDLSSMSREAMPIQRPGIDMIKLRLQGACVEPLK